MEINQKVVNDVVRNLGLTPDKDLGQNFLIDSQVCSRIADALELSNKDNTLEIGGGLGSLTHFLVNKSKNLDVVDIDTRMCNFLQTVYKDSEANIINSDIRKVDVSNYTKITGNLPYYITTELVTFLLENSKNCNKMVFMIQTEAVNRFIDTSGKEYGAISVLCHLLGKPKRLFSVKPGAFYPIPKCGSTVFEVVLHSEIDRETALAVYKMTKQLFLNRRKTLSNNLGGYLGDKDKANRLISKLGLSATVRPEEIEPKTYLELYKLIKEK